MGSLKESITIKVILVPSHCRRGLGRGYSLSHQAIQFHLILASKAQQQLDELSPQDRKQYHKAFHILTESGPVYRSLRTHRYRYKGGGDIWGSSASMAKRFYWQYVEDKTILITGLDSH